MLWFPWRCADCYQEHQGPDEGVLGKDGRKINTLVCISCVQIYEHDHHKAMSCGAVAQLLATMLYHRRFFPYYTYNILAGLDNEGRCVDVMGIGSVC